LRWGSPTATPPFEPLGLAPKEMLKDILPLLELNGQFDKLTDHTGARSLSLPKGPPQTVYLYRRSRIWLRIMCSSFRVSASVFSVKFRVNPWLMLLLTLPSVANLRFCLVFLLWLSLHNKTNYALYLNNNLGFIIKNYYGRIRRIRANRAEFRA